MKKITFLFILAFISQQFLIAQVRIAKVDPDNNKITLKNYGSTTEDITGKRLCAKFSYTAIASGMIDTGDLNLSQNEEVILTWAIDAPGSDLGFYAASGSFGDANNMLDFTQWGTAGNGRESVAVTKGIWSTGDFITSGAPYTYVGNGTQNGLSFWQNTLSTVSVQNDIDFSISPNPATSDLTIKLPSIDSATNLEIYNVLGKRIHSQSLESIRSEINISSWNSGLYMVKITSLKNNATITKRFIKL